MSRVSRFRIATHLDGKAEVTVEIRYDEVKRDGVVSIRPLHSRVEYTGLLSDAAQFVAARHAKALAAANGITVPRPRGRRR